jgi:hypothetical protein
MTDSTFLLRSPARATRQRRLRADPLAVALLGAVALGLVALWFALAATGPAGAPPAAGRVAVVVDAGGRPGAALVAAERLGGRSAAAVRAPRSAFEAAADVRYFAAQRYGRVVVAGSLARAAASAVAREYPRTRFVVRARVP